MFDSCVVDRTELVRGWRITRELTIPDSWLSCHSQAQEKCDEIKAVWKRTGKTFQLEPAQSPSWLKLRGMWSTCALWLAAFSGQTTGQILILPLSQHNKPKWQWLYKARFQKQIYFWKNTSGKLSTPQATVLKGWTSKYFQPSYHMRETQRFRNLLSYSYLTEKKGDFSKDIS